MQISTPMFGFNPETFEPIVTVTVSIPLEPITASTASGRVTVQEFARLIGEEILEKIKNNRKG